MLKTLAIIFTTFLLFSCSASQEEVFSVESPWIREAPPRMKMMAGYATLKNGTNKEISVIGVESDTFNMVEMHTTEVIDGTARMIEQEKLVVPAKGDLSLAPGGFHFMLMMPMKQLKAGDLVKMNVKLETGESLPVEFEVKKGSDMAGS